MSVYATFFTIDDDDDHTRDCARHAVAPTPEREVYWYEGGDKDRLRPRRRLYVRGHGRAVRLRGEPQVHHGS